MATYQFKASLNCSETECWRKIDITPEKTLEKLAQGIISAFGFDFDHAFGFYDCLDADYSSSEKKYELFAYMDDDFDPDNNAESVRRT